MPGSLSREKIDVPPVERGTGPRDVDSFLAARGALAPAGCTRSSRRTGCRVWAASSSPRKKLNRSANDWAARAGCSAGNPQQIELRINGGSIHRRAMFT
ncbi:MAG TPA: hypothetical protein PJ982_09135, partial [Lacipirellulaceae bacterium]|nr:hypothetical protein [Lacipirellulaceae bacterium]